MTGVKALVIVATNLTVLDIGAGESELVRLQTHGAKVLDGVGPLVSLALLGPLVLLGHQVDDLGQSLKTGLGVEERETGTATDGISSSLGVLVAACVANLAVDVGVEGRDALAANGETSLGRSAEGGDHPRTVTVGLSQVLSNLSLDAVVLDEVDEEGVGEAVSTDELELGSRAGAVELDVLHEALNTADKRRVRDTLGLETEVGNSFVDSLLGHLAVGSPLATRDCEKTGFGDGSEMVADKALRCALVGVANERTDTRPSGKDITTADLDFRLEVALDLAEDPVDLVFRRNRVVLDLARGIGGASNGVSLPRQEEDHAAIGGVGVDETHVARSVVAGEDNVNAGRR
jgi:hypothetical protein